MGKKLDGALYKSTDGAEHWQKVPLPAEANAPNDLVFDPSNPDFCTWRAGPDD